MRILTAFMIANRTGEHKGSMQFDIWRSEKSVIFGNSQLLSRLNISLAKIMPAAAAGAKLLEGTDDFIVLMQAFAVCQCIVLENGLDFAQSLVAL